MNAEPDLARPRLSSGSLRRSSLEAALGRALLSVVTLGGSRARLTVLTFHQVAAEPDPLFPDVPDARLFESQIGWLAEFCTVLPLPEAASHLAAGHLAPRAACITFDDGYANNLEVAAPILRRLRVPATFFIAGGAIDVGIMWNDLVIEGVRVARDDLDLTGVGLGRYPIGDAPSRRAAVQAIIQKLKYRPLGQRLELARAVYSAGAGQHPPPRLMMTRADVADLARQDFDIGAHTINHPILNELHGDEARREITRSYDWVKEVTGKPPRSFAYPNGRPGVDYAEQHVAMVADAGFDVAVSTAWGCATRSSPMLQLPRVSLVERDRSGVWWRLAKTALDSYLRTA